MSQNSLNSMMPTGTTGQPWFYAKVWLIIALPLWVFVGFISAEFITKVLISALVSLSVPLATLNASLFSTIIAAIVYIIAIAIVVGVPWILVKYQTGRAHLGLTRLPTWTDLIMAPAGLVIYFILSALLLLGATHFLPGFNENQVQNTGFSQLTQQYQYILAFITLVVIAPLAEETLFRGFLYGGLRKVAPVWLAIVLTSALFGALHGAWNVGIDTFALSIVLCLLREYTGSIWASVLLHMMKNAIAFYLLFINPGFFSTL